MTSHSVGQSASAPAQGSTAAPYEQPAIDLVHLSRQTMGDKALEAELLRLFATQARITVEALARAATPAATGREPADLLHTLCGSARAVGAWGLADEAQQLESLLRRSGEAKTAAGSRDSLVLLGRGVDRVCHTIEDLLAERD